MNHIPLNKLIHLKGATADRGVDLWRHLRESKVYNDLCQFLCYWKQTSVEHIFAWLELRTSVFAICSCWRLIWRCNMFSHGNEKIKHRGFVQINTEHVEEVVRPHDETFLRSWRWFCLEQSSAHCHSSELKCAMRINGQMLLKIAEISWAHSSSGHKLLRGFLSGGLTVNTING